MTDHEKTAQENVFESQQALLFEQAAAQMNAEIHTVGQYGPSVFDVPPAMAGAVNDREQVSQSLHGIVKAGGELFGIVHVNTVDMRDPQHTAKGFILTRFAKGDERASIVGQLEPRIGMSLDVGRHNLEGVSEGMAMNHFNIAINPDGKLVVEDNGSQTGTELMLAPKGVDQMTEQLRDINKWAPKSASVKASIATRRDVNTARLGREYEQKRLGHQPTGVQSGHGELISMPDFSDKSPEKPKESAQEQAADPRSDLEQQEASFEAKLAELEEPFSEDNKLNLWRFGSGKLNKSDAQKRGDGNEAMNQGQQLGQAYKELSPTAKDVAQDYYSVMFRLEQVRDRLNKLQ